LEFINTFLNYPLGGITVQMLLSAVLILVIGIALANLLVRPLRRLIDRASWDASLKRVVLLIIRAVLYAVVVLIAADSLRIPITSVLTAFSIVGLAVSLAIQDTLANMFSGMLLLASKTLSGGDYVQIDAFEGTVTDVDLMNTYLLTTDHKTVRIPNKTVQNAAIVNFSRQTLRRVEFRVTASYDAPTDKVKAALLRAAERVDAIVSEPAPFAGLAAYQNSSIEYVVQAWAAPSDYRKAFYALSENIREAFAEDGIEMTYDHLNIHMKQGE